MAIRPIRLFGDPILLTEAEPVTDFDRPLHTLVKDLTETLRDAGGAGLAAPQIGVGLRVFAYSVGGVVERSAPGGSFFGPGVPAPAGRPRALTRNVTGG
jgi:peptide deformylase